MIVYLSVLDSQEKKSKFEQIYLAYRKQMYYAAFQILQHDEDSEDAVHHAFIKIAENIEKLHSKGIKVNCWTCDDKEVAEKLVSYGVDFITSNILE